VIDVCEQEKTRSEAEREISRRSEASRELKKDKTKLKKREVEKGRRK
jgi:hypothetical protein